MGKQMVAYWYCSDLPEVIDTLYSLGVLKRLDRLLGASGFEKISGDDCSDIFLKIHVHSGLSFVDENIIFDVAEVYGSSGGQVRFEGAIPGSCPELIEVNSCEDVRNHYVRDQGISGVNFDIGRPLRKKVFTSLMTQFPKFQFDSFAEIVSALHVEEVSDLVLAYGESKVSFQKIEKCPLCGSEHHVDLYHSEGNMISGFLPNTISVYRRCHSCELVYMSKQLPEEELSVYYTDDSYARSQSSDEHAKRWANLSEVTTSHFGNYMCAIKYLAGSGEASPSILDLGCGDGDFVSMVRSHFPSSKITAVDWFLPNELKSAMQNLDVSPIESPLFCAQLESKLDKERYDLITLWEVVEHLKIDSQIDLLQFSASLLKPDGVIMISTPDFEDPHCQSLDFWSMAAGEHLSVFSVNSFGRLLERCGLKMVGLERESVTVKLPRRWYEYGAKTSSTLSGKAAASIVESFLTFDSIREPFKQYCRERKIGSEMIVTCKPI